MADDEQFSLCWNNFNSNLSAGFHESLCRGDLVDVTLAAEGQFVKAHRLVLSVCSPYFRKMFTQMPANQHAFVFLKDVSHTALKDLIQFMYCGEVNVKQEALPAFISTAEALQIKGLTDSDPPQSQTPPEPSTPTPQIQSQQIQASPRVRHRTSTGRSYKIETVDDSGDDTKQTTQIVIQTTAPSHPPQATITTQAPQQQHHHHHHHQQQQQHQPPQQHIAQQPIQTQTHQLAGVSLPTSTATTAVVTHKRPAQRTNLGSVPHIKRSKSTIDPLEASDATVATQQLNVQTTVVTSDVTKSQSQQHHHHQQQQQTQSHHHQSQPQQTNEPEYIDMPMELPTKSEPDYVEDAGEVDQGEQDGTYVEDESYGDMRYDESYFTEGEEAGGAAGNAATGGATSTSATATTSKAIVKSQPLSDSAYMDSTGDQANSDAQAVPGRKQAGRGVPYLINKKANLATKPTKNDKATTSKGLETLKTATKNSENVRQKFSNFGKLVLEPLDKSKVEEQLNSPKSVVKQATGGHSLNIINRKRCLGLCVYCLRKPGVEKQRLSKITTYCTACPGGCWMCESCFDELHAL
ncbi:modifier of mdg4 isoform X8 [Stomoxys calcitrans]|uniref:BTB domain-containing protein n=1 Tax=Stomoxys calcitrans TaxID=35570 RepID=A0A1I8PGR2_STOCA|nr:modifier of mdg4 isoform X8 [Stomoxys calcitrans]